MKPMSIVLLWGYLIILLLGYSLAGWLLAAFQVSWLIWSVTFLVTLHLIRSGPAAIALSSSWVIGLISLAAVMKAWTPVWNSQLPHEHAQLWAQGLLLIWFGAIGLVVLLAFAPQLLARSLKLSTNQVIYGLVILIWTAMAIGRSFY